MAVRKLNVYLAASMRGGGDGKGWKSLEQLASIVGSLGHVPMNEVCKGTAPKVKAEGKGDDYLYNRDLAWLAIADCLIADVTYPSLGVGYEVAAAIREMGVPVLALCHTSIKQLSALFNGNTEPLFTLVRFNGPKDIEAAVRQFLDRIKKKGARKL